MNKRKEKKRQKRNKKIKSGISVRRRLLIGLIQPIPWGDPEGSRSPTGINYWRSSS